MRIVCIAYVDAAPFHCSIDDYSPYTSPNVVSGVIERNARANPRTRLH